MHPFSNNFLKVFYDSFCFGGETNTVDVKAYFKELSNKGRLNIY